jgi:hypothetical protein
MIKKFEQYNNSDIDPYGEEEWEDEDSIKEGDIVICINNDIGTIDAEGNWILTGKNILVLGLDYEVIDLLYYGRMLTLRGVKGVWDISRFVKEKRIQEHIHYLMDDYDDRPQREEMIDVVGLPSGQYAQIRRKDYEDFLTQYINWSERLKCYVCRDKDFEKIFNINV